MADTRDPAGAANRRGASGEQGVRQVALRAVPAGREGPASPGRTRECSVGLGLGRGGAKWRVGVKRTRCPVSGSTRHEQSNGAWLHGDMGGGGYGTP